MAALHIPLATYRLQFSRQFGFRDALNLVPYLQKLGITDLYASPLLTARHGSLHGYDVTDPANLNPELGSREDFESLHRDLKMRRMGLLLDIVPNHMSISSENRWWMDVLESGPHSAFASYFDIDWHYPKPALRNKVLLPLLGAPYGSILESQLLRLSLEEDGFFLNYGDLRFPVALKSYLRILKLPMDNQGSTDPGLRKLAKLAWDIERLCVAVTGNAAENATVATMERSPAVQPVSQTNLIFGTGEGTQSPLPDYRFDVANDPQANAKRNFSNERDAVKHQLWALYEGYPAVRDFIDRNLLVLNGRKGDPASFEPLDQLLDEQAYWLCFWRLADEEINYRRFFTISDLICLRVEDPAVFRATHALILELMRAGKVQGVRVDHVDGLHDPRGYLERLSAAAGGGADVPVRRERPYLVVEKILGPDEPLPRDWPVGGTTGYDALNTINGIFVDGRKAGALDEIYAAFTGSNPAFKEVAYAGKHLAMRTLFGGEMRTLGYELARLAEQDRHVRDLPRRELERALVEVTACLPIYRTYTRDPNVSGRDRGYIERAFAEARIRNQSVSRPVFDFLESVLLLESPSYLAEEQRQARLRFVMRWQQFTGPIMAKGVEDTAIYVYNRLISLNEVGGDPGGSGLTVEAFHSRMRARHTRLPYSLNATATHDTKRGEDVRARINVLSEIPEDWSRKLGLWSRLNRPQVRIVDGRAVPDRNEEYFLYQTLLGTWPLQKKELPELRRRLEAYAVKAAREAKVHTRWTEPELKRERALVKFIRSILAPVSRNRFIKDFLAFESRIAFYGALNGLSQVLLKIACPGIPDFYQGTELWDLSLVDPDNRRPVNFATRIRLLEQTQSRPTREYLEDMVENWQDGRIKLFLASKGLCLRRANRELFLEGDYIPLGATGKATRHICAFARHWKGTWVAVVVPRLLTSLVSSHCFPLGQSVWRRSALRLPREAPVQWMNILTGESLEARPAGGDRQVHLAEVFSVCPVALLMGGPAKTPASGRE